VFCFLLLNIFAGFVFVRALHLVRDAALGLFLFGYLVGFFSVLDVVSQRYLACVL
jgi:hypothetical protein